MVKDNDQQKWVRPKATFKLTKVTKIELRPWKCPVCEEGGHGPAYSKCGGVEQFLKLSVAVWRSLLAKEE